MTSHKIIVNGNIELDDKSNISYFGSREQARQFKKKVNGVVIDTNLAVNQKHPQRWAVIYPVSQDNGFEIHPSCLRQQNKSMKNEGVGFLENNEDITPVILMTPGTITILRGVEQYKISRDEDDYFNDACDLYHKEDFEGIYNLYKLYHMEQQKVEIVLSPQLKIMGQDLYWYGIKYDGSLAAMIIKDQKEGKLDNRYVKLFENLMENPSYLSVKNFFDFIKSHSLKITEDGMIVAWKKVYSAYNGKCVDVHTKKVPNYKGVTVTMPRNLVEDNPNISCSHGLHVASYEYASAFGGDSLVEVLVNPADIVSVPYDYDCAKCRCCKYTVLTGQPKPEDVPDIVIIDREGNILEEIFE